MSTRTGRAVVKQGAARVAIAFGEGAQGYFGADLLS
jgi:hypothetical protein